MPGGKGKSTSVHRGSPYHRNLKHKLILKVSLCLYFTSQREPTHWWVALLPETPGLEEKGNPNYEPLSPLYGSSQWPFSTTLALHCDLVNISALLSLRDPFICLQFSLVGIPKAVVDFLVKFCVN